MSTHCASVKVDLPERNNAGPELGNPYQKHQFSPRLKGRFMSGVSCHCCPVPWSDPRSDLCSALRSKLIAAANSTHPPISAITPTPMARPAQNPPPVEEVPAATYSACGSAPVCVGCMPLDKVSVFAVSAVAVPVSALAAALVALAVLVGCAARAAAWVVGAAERAAEVGRAAEL